MRLYLLILCNICMLCAHSQVGINIKNPLSGTLHIDPQGDSPSNVTDDVFIDSDGNMSVGHVSPGYRLDIKTRSTAEKAFLLEDGSEGNDKILLSDINGVASWGTFPGELQLIKGKLNNGLPDLAISDLSLMTSSLDFIYANAYITLPPGRWLVTVSMILIIKSSSPISNSRGWIRGGFADSTPSFTNGTVEQKVIPPSVLSGAFISGICYAAGYGMMNGFSVINNPTSNNATYYFGLRFPSNINLAATDELSNFASIGTNFKENQIIAIKMANN